MRVKLSRKPFPTSAVCRRARKPRQARPVCRRIRRRALTRAVPATNLRYTAHRRPGRPPLSLEEASDRAHELQTGSRRRKKQKPHAPSRRDPAVTHDPVTILTQRRWGSSSSARAARKRKDERAAASAVYAEEVGSCRRQHFWWLQLSQSS